MYVCVCVHYNECDYVCMCKTKYKVEKRTPLNEAYHERKAWMNEQPNE